MGGFGEYDVVETRHDTSLHINITVCCCRDAINRVSTGLPYEFLAGDLFVVGNNSYICLFTHISPHKRMKNFEKNEDNCCTIATFENGGEVLVHISVSEHDSDYQKLLAIALFFARQGKHVVLTPKLTRSPKFEYAQIYGSLIGTKYEGKCPDMLIDGKWYEHEGFTSEKPKNAFRNMLTHGLKQSSRLIIDAPELTDGYMLRCIYGRITNGLEIDEILLREKNGNIRLLYKKQNIYQ